jgi:hypothetical protein
MAKHDTYFYKDIQPSPEISFQYLKIPIEELAVVGDVIVIDVPKMGDFLRNMYFDMGQNTLENLEYFEILMSQTVIFRFTGEYIHMMRTLLTPEQMKPLVDNVVTLPIGTIPVPYEMRIRAKINSATGIQKAQLGLSAEFGYIKKAAKEFGTLIEQMQLVSSYESKIFLDFKHCIKELFIVTQDTDKSGFDFSELSRIKLELNQHIKVDEDSDFFRFIQPMIYHTSYPSNDSQPFYVYSFCINPQDIKPSGSVNASRINSMVLTLTFPDTVQKNVRVYAKSYNYLYIKDGIATLKYII